MDEREFGRQTNGYSDYSGYGQKNDDAVRSLEREMILQEYEEDRDAILMTIKDALRENRYDDAQQFVHKYRAAARTDENFAVLARMTAQGLESSRQIETIVTILDATPENDYPARIAACQKILKIQPNNEKYKAELHRCQVAAGISVQKQENNIQPQVQSPDVKKFKSCPVSTALILFMNFILCIGASAAAHLGIVFGLVLGSVLTAFLLNSEKSPMANVHRVWRVLINVMIWFAYIVVIIGIIGGLGS